MKFKWHVNFPSLTANLPWFEYRFSWAQQNERKKTHTRRQHKRVRVCIYSVDVDINTWKWFPRYEDMNWLTAGADIEPDPIRTLYIEKIVFDSFASILLLTLPSNESGLLSNLESQNVFNWLICCTSRLAIFAIIEF